MGILGGASGSGVRSPMGLEDLAERLGIADLVRFVPPVDRPTLAAWYRAADAVAVPSHSESFGLVAVEAQACGTPVVAANVGGLPIAVGRCRPARRRARHADWATALGRVVLDPEARAVLSRRAVEHAQGFGWAATAEKLLAVYTQALSRPKDVSDQRRRTADGIPRAVIP